MYICIQIYKIKDFAKNVLLYNFASKIKINGKKQSDTGNKNKRL